MEQLGIPICWLLVALLFYLDRDKSARTSNALWLPVIWLWLAGSRSVAAWMGMGSARGLEGTLDGSPLDAAVLGTLELLGIIVLLGRRKKASAYLAVITPIILYSAYCLISVSWAPYATPAFKRWTKDVGDVAMVLIIVTEAQPLGALRRVYSRVAFVLLPLSVGLIRYSTLGRAWDTDGKLSIVGVTDNKNALGLTVFVSLVGVAWNLRWLLMNKDIPGRRRRLLAQSFVFACGLYLLKIANSSTSKACFLLGSGVLLATRLHVFKRKPARVHVLCFVVILAGGAAVLLGDLTANALGRDAGLTGRTDMWAAMLPAASTPIFGAGFDSFWTSPNARAFHRTLASINWFHPEEITEAHNGYIEVYLNLGWIGVSLIALILTTGYWRACQAFRRNPEYGSLILAYIIAGAIYCITEAGFRTLNLNWFFILVAVVSASGISSRLLGSEATNRARVLTSGGRRRWGPTVLDPLQHTLPGQEGRI